jgi:hypothetical protein
MRSVGVGAESVSPGAPGSDQLVAHVPGSDRVRRFGGVKFRESGRGGRGRGRGGVDFESFRERDGGVHDHLVFGLEARKNLDE